jgi:5'-3' exonuclease
LLPFIDQKILTNALDSIDPNLLSPEERARNSFGEAHSYLFDRNATTPLASPVPYLSDVKENNSVEMVYKLPPFPEGKFQG